MRSGLLAAALLAAATPGLAGEADDPPPATSSLTQSLEGDTGLAVQTVCTNCNNADLSVAGMGNQHVSVVCDGLPVPAGLGQVYLLSVMPATMIDKVRLARGAGDPGLEGGAVGGLLEIERRVPRSGLELNAAADTGGFGWAGTKLDLTAGGGEKWGGSFVGSWASSDLVDSNDDGNPDLPSFDRSTLEGAVDLRPTSDQRIRAGLRRYHESQTDGPAAYDFISSLIFGGTFYNREDVDLTRLQGDVLYESELPGGSTLALGALWAKRSEDISETPLAGAPVQPTYFIDDEHRHGLIAGSRPFGRDTLVRAGVSATERSYDIVDLRFNALQGLPPDFVFTETVRERAAWLQAESSLGGTVQLSGGLHWADYDYADDESRPQWLQYSLPEGHRLLPRAALIWKPAAAWRLRFAAGAGFRPPDPTYEEVCCGRQYRNNRGIAMERSRSFGTEATYQPGPRLRLTGSVFVTDFRDLVVKLATLSYQFQPTYQNVNVPRARHTAWGLELGYQPKAWLDLRGAATWLDADNRTSADAIPALIDFFGTPVAKTFRSAETPYYADRRGSLTVGFSPARSGLRGAITALYTGSYLVQRFDETMPDFTLGGSEVQPGFVRTDPYWVVNLALSIRLAKAWTIFAGVDNIGDTVQSDLGDPHFDYDWGPLRGRYAYGGASYRLKR
ncbi:MAG TPA: TonB-dependent receptor [Candidatus Polarisedimenticolaceae bacterium]|nr:TonB-dependent receptor [Candidatus Polarisedimenticolaceae bacterium]